MAFVSHADQTTTSGTSFWAGLKNAVVSGMEAYMTRHSRTREIERLNAMSDAELNAIGVKRDEIVHHVFRDHFYV